MSMRRILVLVPTLLIGFLLQSYFWVPSYEQQTKGNPDRLHEYITAATGDASLLNPILSADSASSDIANLIFEGLIDRDEELRFRPRLAASWDVSEEAYFYFNDQASVPGRGRMSPSELLLYLLRLKETPPEGRPELVASLANIKDIELIPPKESAESRKEKGQPGSKDEMLYQIRISAPARLKMVLAKVDQDLFRNLAAILGEDYFASFAASRCLQVEPAVDDNKQNQFAQEFVPGIEHNPVLVFHLRPDVRFHDGHALDAGDVRFTYEAIMNPKNLSPRISDYEPVKQVEVLDPATVRIVYKRLYSPALGTWSMGILPEHLLNDEAMAAEAARLGKDPAGFSLRQSGFNRRPIGSGPFVFKQWKSDQYISLDRFEDYWEGAPIYKRYVSRIIPDPLTQEMEFYAGTVDNYNVQPHQVERLQNDPRFQDFSGLSFGYTYIGYNLRRPPFDDPRVRRALGMAIDVGKIIQYVLRGQGERITGPFVKQTDYYDQEINPPPFDPQAALELLAEAGFVRNKDGWLEKDGKRLQFTLISNSGNELRKAVLAIVQDAWKQIGVDVGTDLLEWSVFIQERVNKADFDALVLGWSMGIDPDLYQIWHSSQTNPFQLNFVGFKNEAADDLIIRIRQEYDHDRLVQYCRSLHQIIADEQPYTFLYVTRWTAVLDRRIVIQETDAQGRPVYKKITPTKTGNYAFLFNRWTKLGAPPIFAP